MIELTNNLQFKIHGAANSSGSSFSKGLEKTVTYLESLSYMSGSELFQTLLPGISAMANIHPLLVHFPIAFLSIFFLFDLIGSIFSLENWRKTASALLYLGTIFAAATVASGLNAEDTIQHSQNVHEIMETHELIGICVLSLAVFLSIWRLINRNLIQGFSNFIYLCFAFNLNLLLLFGADLGGLMVYKHGVAVEAVELDSNDLFHDHGSHDHHH